MQKRTDHNQNTFNDYFSANEKIKIAQALEIIGKIPDDSHYDRPKGIDVGRLGVGHRHDRRAFAIDSAMHGRFERWRVLTGDLFSIHIHDDQAIGGHASIGLFVRRDSNVARVGVTRAEIALRHDD